MHFFRYRKWPNVPRETAIFNKNTLKMLPPKEAVLGPKMGRRAFQKKPHFWIHFWTHFRLPFGPLLGAIWAPRRARERPRGAQENQKGLLETKRKTLEKVDFRTAYNYAFDPASNKVKDARFSKNGIAGLLEKYEIRIE